MDEQSAARKSPAARNYIHGYRKSLVDGMAARTTEREGAFFLPHLRPGLRLLDAGCGPGSITLGFARVITPGEVVGIDIEPAMVEAARQSARKSEVTNARFEAGNAMELPFSDGAFDAVFAHTLLEHVPDPQRVVGELRRVLKPGGVVGVRDGALSGLVIYPPDPILTEYVELFKRLWQHNGGNPDQGFRTRGLLRVAGFDDLQTSVGSIYFLGTAGEAYAQEVVAPRFADRVVELGWTNRSRLEQYAAAWRQWGENPDAFMASIMVETVGWVPA
jgi:SAM-dependent methyltransferase